MHISVARVGFLGLSLLVCLCGVTGADEYYPPADSQGGWRTATTADDIRKLAGMDAAQLDRAVDFTQRCTQNAALLVVRHGYLVTEKYFGRASRNCNPD